MLITSSSSINSSPTILDNSITPLVTVKEIEDEWMLVGDYEYETIEVLDIDGDEFSILGPKPNQEGDIVSIYQEDEDEFEVVGLGSPKNSQYFGGSDLSE